MSAAHRALPPSFITLLGASGGGCRSRLGGCFATAVRRSGSRSLFRASNEAAFFVVPGRFVIDLCRRIKARIQAVFRQLESLFHDERRVGVVDDIVFGDAIVVDRVLDQPAEKRYVGACSYLEELVGNSRRASEARIDYDQFRVTRFLRLDDPFETTRMVLSGV